MSDERVRQLERGRLLEGEPAAELAWLRARTRSGEALPWAEYLALAEHDPATAAAYLLERRARGELAEEALEVALLCGHAPAALALERPLRLPRNRAAFVRRLGRAGWARGLSWQLAADLGGLRPHLDAWRRGLPDDRRIEPLVRAALDLVEDPTPARALATQRAGEEARESLVFEEMNWSGRVADLFQLPLAARELSWVIHAAIQLTRAPGEGFLLLDEVPDYIAQHAGEPPPMAALSGAALRAALDGPRAGWEDWVAGDWVAEGRLEQAR
ncbi:MAG: hypothetical protein AB7N76_26235 [Planctomycetota bacterium]